MKNSQKFRRIKVTIRETMTTMGVMLLRKLVSFVTHGFFQIAFDDKMVSRKSRDILYLVFVPLTMLLPFSS